MSGPVELPAQALSSPGGMDADVESIEPIAHGIVMGHPSAGNGLLKCVVTCGEVPAAPHGGRHADEVVACCYDELAFGKDAEMMKIVFGPDPLVRREGGKYQLLQGLQLLGVRGLHGLQDGSAGGGVQIGAWYWRHS